MCSNNGARLSFIMLTAFCLCNDDFFENCRMLQRWLWQHCGQRRQRTRLSLWLGPKHSQSKRWLSCVRRWQEEMLMSLKCLFGYLRQLVASCEDFNGLEMLQIDWWVFHDLLLKFSRYSRLSECMVLTIKSCLCKMAGQFVTIAQKRVAHPGSSKQRACSWRFASDVPQSTRLFC